MTKRGRCIVCRKPGTLVVLAGERTGVVACEKHRAHIAVGGEIAGAALKAGVITWMDAKYPGLYDRIARAIQIVKG